MARRIREGKVTQFLGVAFSAINKRLCSIATGDGAAVVALGGLSTDQALAFLWSIQAERRKRALVAYEMAVDLELLFQDLSAHDKDRIFGLLRQAEERVKDTPLYEPPVVRGSPDVLEYDSYRLTYLPGRILRLARAKAAGMPVFDISSYFDYASINQAAAEYLGETVAPVEKNMLPLWREGLIDQIIARGVTEAKLVERLADKVSATIAPLDIKPRQWYGPSAIAARCLSKWGARRQAKRLYEKNSAAELLKAIDCAYFGARVEAVKLGTIKDVRTLDLNSAYGYATTLLSQFDAPLAYTRMYTSAAPFSCWLIDYDLPPSVVLGPLPTRGARGGISYRRRGLGYFWQPEADYILTRWPESCRVRWGFMAREFKPVTFAPDIQAMYDYRMLLKSQGDAGQKIIKLALSNLYGKFAQNTGGAYYQCRAWAGWITSLVRRLLLEAVTGREDSLICFAQDCVHLEGVDSAIPAEHIGEGLGQWKANQYDRGLYVAPGLYDLWNEGGPGKSATRGANSILDFDKIASDLSMRQVSQIERSFFVGWQLSRQAGLKYGQQYLSEVAESLALVPSRTRARNYLTEFNWAKEARSSTICTNFNGQMSARYIPQDGPFSGALRLRLKERGWA